MVDFRNLMYDLQSMGFMEVVLPFILVFAIVYAVLERLAIFKDDDDKPRSNINVIISLVMGITFVTPSITGTYPGHLDPVRIISESLPNVGILVIAIVMLLLLLGVFGIDLNTKKSKGLGTILVIGSVAFVLVIFLAAAGVFGTGASLPSWLWFVYDSRFTTLIVTLLVFGTIIYGVTYKPASEDDKKEQEEFGFDLVKKD